MVPKLTPRSVRDAHCPTSGDDWSFFRVKRDLCYGKMAHAPPAPRIESIISRQISHRKGSFQCRKQIEQRNGIARARQTSAKCERFLSQFVRTCFCRPPNRIERQHNNADLHMPKTTTNIMTTSLSLENRKFDISRLRCSFALPQITECNDFIGLSTFFKTGLASIDLFVDILSVFVKLSRCDESKHRRQKSQRTRQKSQTNRKT